VPDSRIELVVVVVNYETPDLVIQCLTSLINEIEGSNSRIVVVDNCSRDNSLEKLQDWILNNNEFRLTQLIRAESNLGFSNGNNLGILAVNADYYLLLNSDTIVRPGAIAVMLATAGSHQHAGIISPRLEWPDGTPQESCFRYLSPISEFISAAQTGPFTALLRRWDVPLTLTDTIVKPNWTSFACVLLRHDMLNEIGLMDDGFFMYFEDVEFCRRASKAGWEIVHNPDAKVVHLRGGSSPVKQRALERKRLPRYYYASRTRYFYRAYGWPGLTLANVLWTLGRSILKCRELLARRERGAPEKAWLDIWTNWFHPDAVWSNSKQK
jgi:GT2 family glycosyltransferase